MDSKGEVCTDFIWQEYNISLTNSVLPEHKNLGQPKQFINMCGIKKINIFWLSFLQSEKLRHFGNKSMTIYSPNMYIIYIYSKSKDNIYIILHIYVFTAGSEGR